MSVFGIIPKKGFVDPANSGKDGLDQSHETVALVLDCMVSEAPEYASSPTQAQVETQLTVSDHVTKKPLKLAVEGIITDTPVGYLRGEGSLFSGAKPSEKAFAWLEKLWLGSEPFDFVGGFKVYKSMVLSEFRPVRNSSTGDALRFSCVMQQVLIVSSKKLVKPQKKYSSKRSYGNQASKPLNPGKFQPANGWFQDLSPTVQTTGADIKTMSSKELISPIKQLFVPSNIAATP